MFTNMRVKGTQKLQHSIARDFRGGLNTYDSPLNLATRFSTKLVNLYPDSNGGLRLRYGVAVFKDMSDYTASIVEMVYYNQRMVVIGSNGDISIVDAAGNAQKVWVDQWSDTATISTTPFEGKLVICNGIDKPVYMDELYVVRYVADAATGSNINVPRAKYCATHNGYLILAHDINDHSKLYIGNKGTLGTFYGDPGVDNDAVNFDTSQYIMAGDPEITGMVSFRDFLIVGFQSSILAIKLGSYNDAGEHIPTVSDSVPDVGVLNHNCLIPVGDTLFVLNTAGLTSLTKATVTGQLKDTRESTLIGRELRIAMQKFSAANADRYIRMQYDSLLQHILIMIPRDVMPNVETQSDVWVLCLDKQQRLRAWTRYDNMPYRCATRSSEGRIFFGSGQYMFRMYNELEPGYVDPRWLDDQPWDDGTLWDDTRGWGGIDTNPTSFPSIAFEWWMPWADMQQPGIIKQSKYVSMLVEGIGEYTLGMATDRFEDAVLSMHFANTTAPTDTVASDNPSNNEQMYAWPMTFRRMSMRVAGTARDALRFVGINLFYLTGGSKR